jgi:ABC-type proline/glycine betaine transport system permease subunit
VIAILIGVLALGSRNVFTTLVIICIPLMLTNTYRAIDQSRIRLVRACDEDPDSRRSGA